MAEGRPRHHWACRERCALEASQGAHWDEAGDMETPAQRSYVCAYVAGSQEVRRYLAMSGFIMNPLSECLRLITSGLSQTK